MVKKNNITIGISSHYLTQDIITHGEGFIRDYDGEFYYNGNFSKMPVYGEKIDNLVSTAHCFGDEVLRYKIGKNLVTLQCLEEEFNFFRRMTGKQDIFIFGATGTEEHQTHYLKERGEHYVIARYSKFYPGPCEYTGRKPSESGYALDIPKSFDVVKRLITDNAFLTAVSAKDPTNIRTALRALNKHQELKVKATSYLEEVCREL